MINLLPPDMLREMRAARTNTVLRRYLVTSFAALLAVIVIFGVSFYFNQQQYQHYQQQRQESQQNLAGAGDIKQRVQAYNDNLKLAENVYKEEIKMTTLLQNLSSVLPPGAVLSGVSFNLESFSEPVTIAAQVDTFEKAGVLKRNFDQSAFFADVSLQNVTKLGDQSEEGPTTYPFTANLEVTLTPKAAKDPSLAEEAGR